jgi:hypothetical protein
MSFVAVGVRTTRELLRGLPSDAKVLWHVAREYCSEEETDGMIATSILPQLGDRAEVPADHVKRLTSALVRRGLWDRTPEGCVDITFQDDNPTHDDRQRLRDAAKERKRNERRRKAEEAAPGSHTVTSHRDSRGVNGRFRVVSHRDVTVATGTGTEQDSYSMRGSTSARRTRKGAEDNGLADRDELLDTAVIDQQLGGVRP